MQTANTSVVCMSRKSRTGGGSAEQQIIGLLKSQLESFWRAPRPAAGSITQSQLWHFAAYGTS
eukprot:223924-Hanusia_phi.AAC.1